VVIKSESSGCTRQQERDRGVAGSSGSPHGSFSSRSQLRQAKDLSRFTKNDPAGEVIFAAASTLIHQAFNGLLNMNRVFFRLRHQYQK
jgi:hypothetical protein